jgi:hypothetical protein
MRCGKCINWTDEGICENGVIGTCKCDGNSRYDWRECPYPKKMIVQSRLREQYKR